MTPTILTLPCCPKLRRIAAHGNSLCTEGKACLQCLHQPTRKCSHTKIDIPSEQTSLCLILAQAGENGHCSKGCFINLM
jgi:hypothetical protein